MCDKSVTLINFRVNPIFFGASQTKFEIKGIFVRI